MRLTILFTIVLNFCIELKCLPLPSGQIIKYRVPSKYFNLKNETSNDLYNLLTKIHFGDATTQSPVTTIQNVQEESTTEIISNESPESLTTILMDVTEQQQQQTDNGQNLHDLIEKVVNDEIEKLTNESKTDAPNVEIAQSTNSIDNTEQTEVTEAVDESATTTTITSSIEFDNHDDETSEAESISTNVPNEQTTHEHQEEEEENDEDEAGNEIPESLLNAVGDLLSSVLGITIDDDESEVTQTTASKNEVEEENMHIATTESDNPQSTETNNEQQNETTMTLAADDDKMTEVDKKIENLNVQNTFMTENVPEIITESIKNNDDENQEILEVTEEENLSQPVSIDESVNHVMNLIKNAAQDADRQVNDVYTTLKQIGTTFGLTESNTEESKDELKSLSIDSYDPETIKNFETDINEMVSVGVGAHPDEQENFVPNIAKAAMFYKYQYDDDF
ncbi:hypothetical protein PVAND_007184 [Polypedilum vanderplanki]|uniref:Uncharacterized protein n=1 Tax=Polypedilum vanderplanki TaxID=319348 RepID=A0A9J6C5X3_POLVA|nr:hypothetical protein PVAND_007184 [Polypedilum vanderplanki]